LSDAVTAFWRHSAKDSGHEKNTAEAVSVTPTRNRTRTDHVKRRLGSLKADGPAVEAAAKTTRRIISVNIAKVPSTACNVLEKYVLPIARADMTPAIPKAHLTAGTALMAAFRSRIALYGAESTSEPDRLIVTNRWR
jgi:hypothetical protein